MSESESVNVISDKMLALVHDATNAAYNRACATEWGRGVKAAILAEKQTETALVEAIAELEAENARLKAERRWIPVSERLPEANKCVLIYDAGGNMTVDILVKSGGVETYFWLPKYRILFWMPLPEPPVNQLTAHNDTERKDDKWITEVQE